MAVLGHELVMRALLHDMARSHNNDHVCGFDSIQSLKESAAGQQFYPFLQLEIKSTYVSD